MKKVEKKDNRTYEGNIKIRTVKDWDAFAAKKYDKVNGSIYMQGCTGDRKSVV